MAQTSNLGFQVHLLNADSEFSSATSFDINGDERNDIICGAYWYAAPTWERRRFREVEQIRGRFDDYSNLALDVDFDGDLDIVSVNYRSSSLYYSENPGPQATQAGAIWDKHVIDTPGPSETGRLVDLDGDGDLDILPNGTRFAAWYELRGGRGEPATFVRHDLPEQLIGHGLGTGDINADGNVDVVCARGWAEAPRDPRVGRWVFHSDFELASDCGLPILCWDVDSDGDTDLVWSRGHNVGLYWSEQTQASEGAWSFEAEIPGELVPLLQRSRWIHHAIDTQYACLHTLLKSDLDGNGVPDLIAGKRFLGHDGRDPGENDPLSVTSYEYSSEAGCWKSRQVAVGGRCGIDLDTVVADLDEDGDLDLVAPSRAGLSWIENLGEAQEHQPDWPEYASHMQVDTVVAENGEEHQIATALDHGLRRWHILRGMERAMGELPLSNRRTPLHPVVNQFREREKYYELHLTYRSEPEGVQALPVPAILLIPKGLTEPAAAMLCLHPTQQELGKAQICGLGGKPSRFYAKELAERGFVCLAPDYPSFAEYREYAFASDGFRSGTMKAIWDNVRAIDLLETLPCVNRDSIGVIGHSLGGHNALFTAAFDLRLRCVVTSCGFTAMEDYYQGDLRGWTSPRYMPLIASKYGSDPARIPFDFPEVLAAIAPRPVFVNAPVADHNFDMSGVRKCQQAVTPIYELLQAKDNLEFVYPEAEHDFPKRVREQVYGWLKRKLGGK